MSEHGIDEAGIDGGGVFKEYLDMLCKVLCDVRRKMYSTVLYWTGLDWTGLDWTGLYCTVLYSTVLCCATSVPRRALQGDDV